MPKMARSVEQKSMQKSKLLFRGVLEKRMKAEEKTPEQLAKLLNCSIRTFRSRIADPGCFSLSEMRILFKALHYTDTEIMESIRGVG